MKLTEIEFSETIDILEKEIEGMQEIFDNYDIDKINDSKPAASIKPVDRYAGANAKTIEGLMRFESDLRDSLKNITYEKLYRRRLMVSKRLAEISQTDGFHKVGSRQWVMLQQWFIRHKVYEPIWDELHKKHITTYTLPKRLKELKHFLHGALDDISYENLLLRQKTAEGYMERLMPWSHCEGTSEWAEFHEWHLRLELYKLKIAQFQKPDEIKIYNKMRRMWLPDQVPNYNPCIHNYTLEQYYKLQLLITTFRARWGYQRLERHREYSPIRSGYTHLFAELYHRIEGIFDVDKCEFFLIEGNLLRFKYPLSWCDMCEAFCQAYGAEYIPNMKAWKFSHVDGLYNVLHHMQRHLANCGNNMRILDLQTLVLSHQPPAPNSNQ